MPMRSISVIVIARIPRSLISARSAGSSERTPDQHDTVALDSRELEGGVGKAVARETECRRERHTVDVPGRAAPRPVEVAVRVDPHDSTRLAGGGA